MNNIKHYYLHADLDAFFASVEQLDHPEYRGKPLIVGGKPEDKRSVVSTASYEARAFGVHSAMPVAKAYQLCPQGIFVHGRMKRYSEVSYQIMNIFRDFSPDVQQMSIDEAFIDLTGTEKLFGPPEQTAKKIKERVKNETGLTVSIGLAPTKYLAKLASDMKKPDGFYMIEEGTEQEFMLNLPLKKVWGIGDKTYEALKSNGLRTTRDVFEKSLEALVFMFGQNTGSFLYNVIRGIEAVTFDKKTKSHSISNETTFPVDISNIYTAETVILDLCHSVIFRLLKENGFSRTVMVKIRYEDFSTVSIQQTYSNSILTLDSLYAAAKELFERKYERGRGIRLIGIALENIEETEHSYQQSLFDDNSEKKQNVEKAILTLEKKHPEIKIHKARTLESFGKGIKIFVFALLVFFAEITKISGPANAYCEDSQTEEASDNWEISGYWQGNLKGSVDSTFGFGNPFGISAQPPVFTQEVDLSALIHITPQFFFSMEFLDEFNKNTYTLGYDGTNYLKLFRFSNRLITFPKEYSSSRIGYGTTGGQNEAPGIMFHFTDYENQKWSGDFMLRYDMTETKTATFYGKNRVNDSNLKAENYLKANMFVIPSEVINNIKDIYIQSDSGTYKDNYGINYERLSRSNYIILSEQKLLVLSQEAVSLAPKDKTPYILITFFDSSDISKLLLDTGSYSDSTSFTGMLEQYFNTFSEGKIKLSDWSKLEQDALSRTISGDNSKGFLIQSPDSFSPYLCANIYNFSISADDYIVTDKFSSTQNSFYNVEQLAFDFDSSVYAAVSKNTNLPVSPLTPEFRFPFADRYPYLYLENNKQAVFPYEITARNYTPVKDFDIGKKASDGTVKVYINGILEPGAIYDSESGFVRLPYEPDELDKIFIIYSEESGDISRGAFTTAIGFMYNFLPALTLDLSFTGKYPYSADKAPATQTDAYNTFSAFTTGLSYNGKNLTASDIVSTAIEDTNTTDILYNAYDSIIIYSDEGITFNNSDKLDISWLYTKQTELQNKKITAVAYFPASDFSQYNSINIDFSISKPAALTFVLESAAEEKALEIILNQALCSSLVSDNSSSHTLTVILQTKQVYIDGNLIDSSQYELTVNGSIVPQTQKIIITPASEEGKLYVSGVYYKSNTPFFTAKNKASIQYKNEVWFLQADSTQGISIKTDTGKKMSDYINSSVKTGIAFFGIKLNADTDFVNSSGHSLSTEKPLFSVLDFGEAYRHSASTTLYDKKNYLKLDFSKLAIPLSLNTEAAARITGRQKSQNYSAQLISDFKSEQAGFYFSTRISAAQKQDSASQRDKNYFSTLYNASCYEFSSGEKNAQRNILFNGVVKGLLPWAKLSPELTVDFSGTEKIKQQGFSSSDNFKFVLPISTTNNAFSVSMNHKATLEQKSSAGINYADDIQNLFENQKEYNLLYSSIPYYSLFDKKLEQRLRQKAAQNNISYASQLLDYEFNWRRKLFNGIKDLYIPYSVTAGASRNLISTKVKSSDVYELKAAITTSFINLFGKNSLLNYWNWYKQEEYTGTLSATYKFSPDDKAATSFVINSNELMLFYIDNSNTLTLGTEFSLDQKINWKFKTTASWNRSTQDSLLLELTKMIWSEARQMEFKCSVKDSASIALGRQNKINKQTYEYTRSSEIKYTENVYISSGAGLTFGFEQNKTFRLSFLYNLGIKILY